MQIKADIKSTVDLSKIQAFIGPGDDVLIGYPEGRPHPGSTLSMDELARTQTYGDSEIPARPFLEEGILEKKNEVSQMVREHYEGRVEGKDKKPTLARIGAFCVGAVKEFVFGDFYKQSIPNAESTIYRKSRRQKGKVLLSDKPLIDSGDMINATTYVVVKGKS